MALTTASSRVDWLLANGFRESLHSDGYYYGWGYPIFMYVNPTVMRLAKRTSRHTTIAYGPVYDALEELVAVYWALVRIHGRPD